MLDPEKILARANELYAAKKLHKKVEDLGYVPPECMPQIQSDQVKVIVQAIVEAFNSRVQY